MLLIIPLYHSKIYYNLLNHSSMDRHSRCLCRYFAAIKIFVHAKTYFCQLYSQKTKRCAFLNRYCQINFLKKNQFTLSPAMYESIYSLFRIDVTLFIFYLMGEMIFHCFINLHFPDYLRMFLYIYWQYIIFCKLKNKCHGLFFY